MKVNLKWENGMKFVARGDSQHAVVMDTSFEHGGKDEGVRPMELLLMGMAGCTGLDVISILKKMRIKLNTFEISVDAVRAEEYPQVFTAATLIYRFSLDNPEPEKISRAIKLSHEKYCSAINTLKKSFPISYRYEINGTAGETMLI
ncbi:OsmC family protein [Desulfotomaculum copahuensis]|uniref:Osmotically inducible protein OsmC n=1 Tax=Desulfotomaculum copahuensis TaxID=1838280 RepID=A0A1B7LKJ1_9FIRM|nr:OsmC family protein [Desulfotomaculum copahuensis]OAT87079.1 hypothetical protein A6M21_01960 [Desulfotomaculum copahuensis]